MRKTLTPKLAVDVRVSNVGNEFYAYNFTSNGRGGGAWNVGMPRSYEVSLTAGF